MRFYNDQSISMAVSDDGRYAVRERGDRFGRILDVSFRGRRTVTVWVRENNRDVLPLERSLAGAAEAVVEWVVDNGAQTGVDRLITLADGVGDATLGEVLLAYFEARETGWAEKAHETGRPWPTRLVRVGCRGNQRALMEERW